MVLAGQRKSSLSLFPGMFLSLYVRIVEQVALIEGL